MIFNPNKNITIILLSLLLLLSISCYGFSLSQHDVTIDEFIRNQAPSATYWFGTDNLGQNLWTLCFQGVNISLQIGLLSATFSGLIALLFATVSLFNKTLSMMITGLINLMLSLPHLLLLILVCFTIGGGAKGIVMAIALTHWPKLTLILRAEMLRVCGDDYIKATRKMGRSAIYCWFHHILPQLIPQWFIGTLLIFPHAILHSSALSFLGFGLSTNLPSLGLLLANSVHSLAMGYWWLAFFPGLILVIIIILFDRLAQSSRKLWLRMS